MSAFCGRCGSAHDGEPWARCTGCRRAVPILPMEYEGVDARAEELEAALYGVEKAIDRLRRASGLDWEVRQTGELPSVFFSVEAPR